MVLKLKAEPKASKKKKKVLWNSLKKKAHDKWVKYEPKECAIKYNTYCKKNNRKQQKKEVARERYDAKVLKFIVSKTVYSDQKP